MINHDPSLYIYIYRKRRFFYNIEGQLKGLPRINLAKTCAPKCFAAKSSEVKHLYPREALKKLPPSPVSRASKLCCRFRR
jgi:hypothetical protein